MTTYNITVTEQRKIDGITAAREQCNADSAATASPEPVIYDGESEEDFAARHAAWRPPVIYADNQAYLNFVLDSAADSYAKTYID